MNQNQYKKLIEISQSIQEKIGSGYGISVILGSGYSDLLEEMDIKQRIRYADIHGFPNKIIEGQKGEIITIELMGKKIIFFSGRFHYYQGYSSFEVTLPVRISKILGSKIMIVTNAAGGINQSFNPGDIMIITDHINLMRNPLIGFSVKGYDIFVDMSEPYSLRLKNIAMEIAEKMGFKNRFKEGVYIGTSGPSYETRAEINFFRRIGADAVGMSTVPEVIVANQESIETFGISIITNMATGISDSPLSHKEVLKTTAKTKKIFYPFLKSFIKEIVSLL